jgi:RNA recognition motif-containing protein
VDCTLTDTDLYQFFQAQCGTVVKVQMAGNITQPTRFAFVEFESPQAAGVACGMTGTYVGGYAIQISPAKSPIQSATALVIPPSSGTDALSKVGGSLLVIKFKKKWIEKLSKWLYHIIK